MDIMFSQKIKSKDRRYTFIVWKTLKMVEKYEVTSTSEPFPNTVNVVLSVMLPIHLSSELYEFDEIDKLRHFLDDENWILLQKEIFELL